MFIANRFRIKPCIGKQNEQVYELLNANNSPLRSCSVAHSILPVGATTPNHYHPHAEEIYYILEGDILLMLGNETATLKKGDTIHIPPNISHKTTNAGNTPAQLLTITIPPWTSKGSIELE